jgi:hypothetical protein
MTPAISSVTLPESFVRAAEVQAHLEGISVEQWITDAVAGKVKVAEFFNRRAQGASGKTLGEILDLVPDNPPDPGDEL